MWKRNRETEVSCADFEIHESDAYMLGEDSEKVSVSLVFKMFSPSSGYVIDDGDLVKFGRTALKVLHTPGHTQGSISLLERKRFFVGDTLFAGSIGPPRHAVFPKKVIRSARFFHCLPWA